MRIGKRLTLALATVTLVAGTLGATPGSAATPLAGETMYWKIDTAAAHGLVAVNDPSGGGLDLAFHLWGLRPSTSYVLRGSTAGCSGGAGIAIFERAFTTNGEGVAWDPVTIAGSLPDIRSVRIVRAGSSARVVCVNSRPLSAGGPNPSIAIIKLAFRGGRGLAVIDETSTRRTVVSVSGLNAGDRHTVVLRNSGCPAGGSLLGRYGFRPDASGRALVDRIVFESTAAPAGLGGSVAAESLRLMRGTTMLVCGTPINAL